MAEPDGTDAVEPRYRVLGPLHVRTARGWEPLGSNRWRTVLAVLLARRNRTIATNYLLAELWADKTPASGAKPLQVYIGRLRRHLGDPSGTRLVTRPSGYELLVGDGELDADAFTALSRSGRADLAHGEPERAAVSLRAAMDLWRGPAFADVVTTPVVDAEVDQLTSERRTVVEARFAAELAAGTTVLGELTVAVREYPLSEMLRAHLMLALQRSGHTDAAVLAYRDLRQVYRRELQIEPSVPLTRLCETIRDGTVTAEQEARWRTAASTEARPHVVAGADRPSALVPVPRQAPPDIASFTGRTGETEQLAAAVRRAADSSVPGVCAVDGPGGVGKTALVVRVAHGLGADFPDGCLYADLHGTDGTLPAVDPVEVLDRFSSALGGSDGARSDGLDEAGSRFRSLIADRRVLVVLDDAADEQQVRPLLPAGPGCAVLLTSRRMLSALDVGTRVRLPPLPDDEALELLAVLGGSDRMRGERAAAEHIARSCGGLPLALRIVAARMSTQPQGGLARLADRLADERHRLDELQSGDLAVRSSFHFSYRTLTERGSDGAVDARAFRLMGLADCPQLGVSAAAALLGLPTGDAERSLERLATAHLLTAPGADRYGMHDLLRLYARERAMAVDPEPHRVAALGRLLDWYRSAAHHAVSLLHVAPVHVDHTRRTELPAAEFDLHDAAQARRWLELERHSMLTLVQQAAALPGPAASAVLPLARTVTKFLDSWGFGDDVRKLGDACLTVARRSGDIGAEAEALNTLGMAAFRAGRADQAGERFRHSLELRRALGDVPAVASSLNNLGLAHRRLGEHAVALGYFRECLRLRRGLGDRSHEGSTLDNMGLVHLSMGEFDLALHHHRQAFEITRELDNRPQEGLVLLNLGEATRRTGRPTEAIRPLCEALAICREFGNRYGMGLAMWRIGNAHHDLGHRVPSLAYWEEAADILGRLGVPEAGAVTARLHGVDNSGASL